jgi:hypothetical protein
LRTNLHLLNIDSTTTMADGVLAEFGEGYNNGLDYNDAAKMPNMGESLALYRVNKSISVERRNVFPAVDTLLLRLTNTHARSYQFEFSPTNVHPLITAELEDTYTGLSTPINTQGSTNISFTINGEKSSAAPDRFRIIMNRVTKALATNGTGISAEQSGETIMVSWKLENENSIAHYVLERSNDGVHFNALKLVNAAGKPEPVHYSEADETPFPGNNFYRIKIVDINGKALFTSVVVVPWQENKKDMVVYPNPIKGGIIRLHFLKQPAGSYLVKLFSETGQLLMERKVEYNGLTRAISIPLPSVLSYTTVGLLQVVGPDQQAKIIKVKLR